MAGAEFSAAVVLIKILKRSSRKARPRVSISPISRAATTAPFTEPIPPTIITTNAVIIILFPIPSEASVIGAISMPASPARVAPKAKTIANRLLILMPSAATIVLLDAPAQINIPKRVKFTSQSSPKAAVSPTTIIKSLNVGISIFSAIEICPSK